MHHRRFKPQYDRFSVATSILGAMAIVVGTSGALASDGEFLSSQFDALNGDYRLINGNGSGLRTQYSSRSRYRGYFGWGWCSDLDAKLVKSVSGALVYKGCDVATADIVDPRVGVKNLRKNLDGTYQRMLSNRDVQVFDQNGNLSKLIRSSGELIQFQYLADSILIEAEQQTRVVLDVNRNLAVQLVQEGNVRIRVLYDGFMLSQFGNERYQYDAFRRMVQREYRALNGGGPIREMVGYRSDGIGIGRFERQAASPEGRLLVMVRVNEESGKIEIEAERGAEMYPVRILYDMRLRTLELLGNRKTARSVLTYLMS
jgi:hypothetical protein